MKFDFGSVGSVKMELGAVVAWISLMISLISTGITIYNYNFPPKPRFEIIIKSSKSSNEEHARYQIFIRNRSNGDGVLKFIGLSIGKPQEKNTEYFTIDDSPYSDKYYIFKGNSISQGVIEFSDDFIQGILSLKNSSQKFVYAVFKNEKDDIVFEKIELYSTN